ADGSAKYRDYADYIVRHERAPGVGLLAGWRGEDGAREGKGAPNPDQLRRYVDNGGFWRAEIPESARCSKMANRDYLDGGKGRLAAQGHGEHQPPEEHRERVETYFDPLPIWYEPFEGAQLEGAAQANSRHHRASGDPASLASNDEKTLDPRVRGGDDNTYPL